MQQLAESVMGLLIDAVPEGVVVCDARAADLPVVYVNPAFERLSGHGADELLGRPPQLLQADDGGPDDMHRLHAAIAGGQPCRVTLRHYRKDRTPFWGDVQLQPLRDADGVLTHFAAFYREVSERPRQAERTPENLPTWLREDRVSGLSSRAWFEELMQRDWAVARRDERALTLMLFDIDGLDRYAETFGKSASDAAIRRVARVISTCFRRGADVIGRWENGCAAVLPGPVPPDGIEAYAQLVAHRVAEMRIHNPRGVTHKFITVSAGVATRAPRRDDGDCTVVVRAAEAALRRASGGGGGLVAVAGDVDFQAPALAGSEPAPQG
jgi:diguanylate cyclase (GGDEF)-like protein/PAS domain S-box-containing protein